MLSDLASADAVTWVAIAVKTLAYGTSLLAAGSVLILLLLRSLPAPEMRVVTWFAIVCAIAAALLSLARLPLRASFLMGGTWQGATEPMMLTLVADSPLGSSVTLRLVGLGLICAIVVPGRVGRGSAALGSLLVAVSFVFRGHALEEPRLILGGLIALHILGLAFWLGAFVPLYRLCGQASCDVAGRLAHEFGRMALWVVAAVVLAGVVTLWLLAGNPITAISTPYGQFFLIKLGVFGGILGLAAWNKFRLTPELLNASPNAGAAMRTSIRMEAALVAAVLFITATLTTVSGPADSNQVSDVGQSKSTMPQEPNINAKDTL